MIWKFTHGVWPAMRWAEEPPELRDRTVSLPPLEWSSVTFIILIGKKWSSFQNQIETPEWCRHVWRNPGAAHHLPDTGPSWGRAERTKWERNPVIHPPTKQWPSANSQTPEERYTFVSVDWSHQTWLEGPKKWLPSNCPRPAWQDLQSRMAEFIKIQIRTRPKTKQSQWIIILAVPVSHGETVLLNDTVLHIMWPKYVNI